MTLWERDLRDLEMPEARLTSFLPVWLSGLTCCRNLKADVLMISDGDCTISSDFAQRFGQQKEALQCRVYSVLCVGTRKSDNFSDEVMVL